MIISVCILEKKRIDEEVIELLLIKYTGITLYDVFQIYLLMYKEPNLEKTNLMA